MAVGLLFSEGIVQHKKDIRSISYCTNYQEEQRYNIVQVKLNAQNLPDLKALDRQFVSSGRCGLCGKAGWVFSTAWKARSASIR